MILVAVICCCHALGLAAGEPSARHVWLVTLDGLRPQELFTGADRRLIDKEIEGVKDVEALGRRFLHEDAEVRRERLMPFFWEVIARQG